MLCSTKKQGMERLIVVCLCVSLLSIFALADPGAVGVNYGRIANDLPSAVKTVELLKSQGIDKVKIYDTDSAVLKALSGSSIKVIVSLPNENLTAAAKYPSFALSWVQKNIVPYYPLTQIHAIAVGNEVFVDPNNTTDVLVPAMKNVQSALVFYKLDSGIKISSPFALSALQSSFPASSGSFKTELIEPVIKPMFDFLRETKSYLMLNAYPFFAYSANADVISLDYALFRENPGVVDSGNGLKYTNLFDAQVDAVYAAIKALKYDDVDIVVTETGWPSNGDKEEIGANPENAQAYNGNLVKRVLTGGGTPLKSETKLVVYLFALYNENKKFGPTSERNYGLFYPSEEKVYEIPFTLEQVKTWKLKPASDRKAQSQAPTKPVYGGESAGSNGTSGVSNSSSAKGPFCVANVKSGKERLQKALDYACGAEGGADCRSIQPGAACYDPNTLGAHATIAFNSYYQNKGRANSACYFGGAAYVVTVPPKLGKCDLTMDSEEDNGTKGAGKLFVQTNNKENAEAVEVSLSSPRLVTLLGSGTFGISWVLLVLMYLSF
ncbi:glucan endo-1,3-beta-glucosidase 14-like isoform X2 [Papaver somniferum]|uniref:glucan endo-1,3-beta-glucosidase 14-like isoform X2 n=1 Tax=Papaver somniferum TaxID=3469 RepID=UPI000E6FA6A6|nr:glucan endo-1,3-beta-glucosidase 14-like isoform X2 [Papaver somniferum]